jgi:hypothetical protein
MATSEPSVRVVDRKVTPLNLEMLARTEAAQSIVVVGRALIADPYGAASNSMLNREELRSAPGTGSDVLRALDGLPGLITDGEFASFSVRGRGPRDNLILVDGLPLDRVVHFDQTVGEGEDIGGGGRYSIFAPNSIASAEFSAGGWSAAYGGRSGSLAAARRRAPVCGWTSQGSNSATRGPVASMLVRPCSSRRASSISAASSKRSMNWTLASRN